MHNMAMHEQQNAFLAVDFISVTLDCIALLGSGCLAFVSLSKRNERKRWARNLLFATALVGLLAYSIKFMRDMCWLSLGQNLNFDSYYFFVNGWLVGWLTALCWSGEISIHSRQRERSNTASDGGADEKAAP